MSAIVPTVRPYQKPAVVSLTSSHALVIDHPTLGMMSMSYADLRAQLDATYAAAQAACAASQSAAAASQVSAAASASTATTQASASGVSASAAGASQVAAAASATAAGVSQTAAGVSASAAGASQTAAGVSATAALASQTAAAASEVSTTASAATALANANTAIAQATAASGSASAANASQIAAGVSAAAAAGSAAAADVSVTTAAASATAAGVSATASSGSASTASAQASASAASAAAAAASATTALQAQAVQYKGGVAGGSVPATAPLAGDYYRITSAGTSQSKTWVIGDQAIYNGSSGSWTQVTGYFAAADAADLAATAALIEREGLRFDGTAGAGISGGGIPAVGTGDWALTTYFKRTLGTYETIIGGGGSTVLAVRIYDGGVDVLLQNSVSTAFTGTIPASGILAVSKASGLMTVLINGAQIDTAKADSNNYATGESTLGLSYAGATPTYINGALSHFCKWNYALTVAEIAALQRRGLVTLPEQRGGSMVNKSTSAFINISFNSFSGASATGFTASATGSQFLQMGNDVPSVVGQKFLLTFNATITGASVVVYKNNQSPSASVSNGANAIVLTVSSVAIGSTYPIIFNQQGVGTLVVSAFSIIPLGTLFEQDSGQRNAGYMVRDTSGNGRHLELPESGVSINDPADTGFIEYTRTTDGYLIGDRRVIPSTGYLFEVVATGNGTVTLGESAGTPANVCASVTLTSTPKILPLLVTQTSTGKLYADLGTATTATFKIRHRAV